MTKYSKSIISWKTLCKNCISILRWDSLFFFSFFFFHLGEFCLFRAAFKAWTWGWDLGWTGSASAQRELFPSLSLPSLSFLICMWEIEVTIPITQGLHHCMTKRRSKRYLRAGSKYLVAKGSVRKHRLVWEPPQSGCSRPRPLGPGGALPSAIDSLGFPPTGRLYMRRTACHSMGHCMRFIPWPNCSFEMTSHSKKNSNNDKPSLPQLFRILWVFYSLTVIGTE